MSWDERLFGFFYRQFSNQVEKARRGEAFQVLKLETCRRQSEILLSALCESSIEIRDSTSWGGFQGSILFLPSSFHFLPNEEEQLLYLEWRLLAASVDFEVCHLPRSSGGIEKILSVFPRLQKNYEKLLSHAPGNCFEFWLGQMPGDIRGQPLAPSESLKATSESYGKGTEIKGKTQDRAQRVSVDDQPENPLTHVFEKVVTAEDYQGGHRKMDGRDEMADQSEALSEINLSHIIRTQQSTESIYKSSAIIEIEDRAIEEEPAHFKGTIHKYPEWFERKKSYEKNWCTVFERTMEEEALPLEYDKKTAQELRLRLESCFSSYQWFSRQKEGPEVDLGMAVDRVVQSHVASKGMGGVPIDNIYLKRRRYQHDFAIQILIDRSLSSDSYVLGRRVMDTTQEALNIFTAAFKDILNEISVASFSSYTRNQVNYHILKDFSESWETLPQKIAALKPDGYTRMGPALRHSGFRLDRCRARKKMILLLSDAKPTDFDHYEGRHGVHDLQKAARELAAQGCHLKVLALAEKKQSHHEVCFGANQCVILKDVRELANSLFYFWYESIQGATYTSR